MDPLSLLGRRIFSTWVFGRNTGKQLLLLLLLPLLLLPLLLLLLLRL
jgi:hypothetical protein